MKRRQSIILNTSGIKADGTGRPHSKIHKIYIIKKLIKTGLWSEHLRVARDKVFFIYIYILYSQFLLIHITLFASSISHILSPFVRHGIYIERCVMYLYLAIQLSFCYPHKIYNPKYIYIYIYRLFFPILRMSILQHYYSSCLCYFTRKFVSSII